MFLGTRPASGTRIGTLLDVKRPIRAFEQLRQLAATTSYRASNLYLPTVVPASPASLQKRMLSGSGAPLPGHKALARRHLQ
jgi:hypothetical protein